MLTLRPVKAVLKNETRKRNFHFFSWFILEQIKTIINFICNSLPKNEISIDLSEIPKCHCWLFWKVISLIKNHKQTRPFGLLGCVSQFKPCLAHLRWIFHFLPSCTSQQQGRMNISLSFCVPGQACEFLGRCARMCRCVFWYALTWLGSCEGQKTTTGTLPQSRKELTDFFSLRCGISLA